MSEAANQINHALMRLRLAQKLNLPDVELNALRDMAKATEQARRAK